MSFLVWDSLKSSRLNASARHQTHAWFPITLITKHSSNRIRITYSIILYQSHDLLSSIQQPLHPKPLLAIDPLLKRLHPLMLLLLHPQPPIELLYNLIRYLQLLPL